MWRVNSDHNSNENRQTMIKEMTFTKNTANATWSRETTQMTNKDTIISSNLASTMSKCSLQYDKQSDQQ